MDLLHQKVQHTTLGKGLITEVLENYITVSFEDGSVRKFQNPLAFEHYLTLCENDLNEEVQNLAKSYKQELLDKEKQIAERLARTEIDLKEELIRRYKKQKNAKKRKSKTSSTSRSRSNLLFKSDLYDADNTSVPSPYNGISFKDFEDGESFESDIFNSWTAWSGVFLSGQKKGQGIRMAKLRPKSLAVLSVLEPKKTEDERVIAGVFMVEDFFEGDEEHSAYVRCHSEYKLRFTKEFASELKLWNYYTNQTNPDSIKLGSGLFRYMDDVQSAQVLRAIVELYREKKHKDLELAEKFLEMYLEANNLDLEDLPENEGPLAVNDLPDESFDDDEDDILVDDDDELIDDDDLFEEDEEDILDENRKPKKLFDDGGLALRDDEDDEDEEEDPLERRLSALYEDAMRDQSSDDF